MSEPVWAVSPMPGADRWFGRIDVPPTATEDECSVCGESGVECPDQPRRIVWQREQLRELGDVIWPMGGGTVFAGPRLADALAAWPGITWGRVVVDRRQMRYQDDKPVQVVPTALMATLEQLKELCVSARVPLDRERSTLVYSEKHPPCDTCGRMLTGFSPPNQWGVGYVSRVLGCEWVDVALSHIDDDLRKVFKVEHHPRDRANAAAVFRRGDVGGAEVWRLADDETWVLCTSRFKEAVERLEATNVNFREVGSVVD